MISRIPDLDNHAGSVQRMTSDEVKMEDLCRWQRDLVDLSEVLMGFSSNSSVNFIMVNILMSSVIKAVLVRVKKEIFYACSAGNFNQ